jgi:hypothetical protein
MRKENKMKRFLLTLLAIVVIAGVLAGVGFSGYRLGYRQAALQTSNDEVIIRPSERGNDFNWYRMPLHRFGEGMHSEFRFGPGGVGMMLPGRGFGFFSGFRFLVEVAILGFIAWLAYKLLTGWRISFNQPVAQRPKVEPVQPVEVEPNSDESPGK